MIGHSIHQDYKMQNSRKPFWLALILIGSFILGFIYGCASNPYQKKQIALNLLIRVDELQVTVADLYKSGSITPEHALVYNKFCTKAAPVLKSLPDGWPTTIKTAWNELKSAVSIDQMEIKVQYTAKLIDGLVGAL